MITNNGMLRNMSNEMFKKEEPQKVEEPIKETHKDNETKEEHKEDMSTYNLLSSIIGILPLMVNKANGSDNTFDYKAMLEKVHNLDKRIAVCEALLNSHKDTK